MLMDKIQQSNWDALQNNCWDIKLVCSMTVRSFWTSSRGREAQARKEFMLYQEPTMGMSQRRGSAKKKRCFHVFS